MKTKWGSCSIEQGRIWLNLELAKKPPECHEYILVHELTHLHERNHNQSFKELLDQFLPHRRTSQKTPNTSPLAHEEWEHQVPSLRVNFGNFLSSTRKNLARKLIKNQP